MTDAAATNATVTPTLPTELPRKFSNLSAVSHELRAPLHAIVGLAELLLERDLDPRDHNLAMSIHREGQALERIVSDLLELEKADAGELSVVEQTFSPRLMVGEVVSAFIANASAKNLTLTTQIDDALPLAVEGDRHRIRQILVNLVSNGIKYTDTGSVTITAELVKSPDIRLRMAVLDTGPGIPDDARPLLFTAYKQTRATDQVSGTGLGLSLIKRLLSLLGGTIWLDSSPAGSTFTFEVPVSAAEVSVTSEEAEVSGGSGRVLIVDDTAVNRLLARGQLDRLGYEATEAVNGPEALQLIAQNDYDAVLLDWHMPGMDGLEVMDHVRADPQDRIRNLPVILTTASVTDADRETCFAHDVSDFLAKPVSLNQLQECLAKWIPDSDPLLPATATETPADATALIDRSRITGLIEELGSVAPVAGLLETFLDDTPMRLRRLKTSTDVEERRREAHTLKATGALLGANEMSNRCAQLEEKWADRSTAPEQHEIDELVAVTTETIAAMQVIRQDLATTSEEA